MPAEITQAQQGRAAADVRRLIEHKPCLHRLAPKAGVPMARGLTTEVRSGRLLDLTCTLLRAASDALAQRLR